MSNPQGQIDFKQSGRGMRTTSSASQFTGAGNLAGGNFENSRVYRTEPMYGQMVPRSPYQSSDAGQYGDPRDYNLHHRSSMGPPIASVVHPLSRLSKEQGAGKRKCCNCKNSRCLKLYCECFAVGVYCDGCNCQNCLNNEANEHMRKEAIESTLERNPTAFRPKIAATPQSGRLEPKHHKGCHCKKSGCLKKYCECFQGGIYCSENCKCSDCRNYDPEFGPRAGTSQVAYGTPQTPGQPYTSQSPSRGGSQGHMPRQGSGQGPYDTQSQPRGYDGQSSLAVQYGGAGMTGPGGPSSSSPSSRYEALLGGSGKNYDMVHGSPHKRARLDQPQPLSSARGYYDSPVSNGAAPRLQAQGAASSSRTPSYPNQASSSSHAPQQRSKNQPDLQMLRNVVAEVINEDLTVDVCSALLNAAGLVEQQLSQRRPTRDQTFHPARPTHQAPPAPAPEDSPSQAPATPLDAGAQPPSPESAGQPQPHHYHHPNPNQPVLDLLTCTESSEIEPTTPLITLHAGNFSTPGPSSSLVPVGPSASQGQLENESPSAFFATPFRPNAAQVAQMHSGGLDATLTTTTNRPVSPITAQLFCEEEPPPPSAHQLSHHSPRQHPMKHPLSLSGSSRASNEAAGAMSRLHEMQEQAVIQEFSVCVNKIFDSAKRRALNAPTAHAHGTLDPPLRPVPTIATSTTYTNSTSSQQPYSFTPIGAHGSFPTTASPVRQPLSRAR